MAYTDHEDLQRDLTTYGELHLILESGAEAHIHRHDCRVTEDVVTIDSKRGEWKVGIDRIEDVEFPESELIRSED